MLTLYLNGVAGGTISDNNFTIVKRPTGSTTWADWDAFDGTTTIPDADQPGRTVASGYMQKSGFVSFSDFGGGGGSGGGPTTNRINLLGCRNHWRICLTNMDSRITN